jgi:CubicO group peptidase (beta-lactamase class C family)
LEATLDPDVNTGIDWALPYFIDAPLVSVPGTQYAYTTMGFNLAGVAVERAAGATFPELMARDITGPLGMRTARADFHWETIAHRAVGYHRGDDGGWLDDGDTDVSWKLPGGGVISTAEDLGRWCAGLMGEVLLPLDVRDRQAFTVVPPASGYGLGFGVGTDEDGRRMISHTGSQEKAKTGIVLWPDDEECAVFMTNTVDADPWAIVTELAAAGFL